MGASLKPSRLPGCAGVVAPTLLRGPGFGAGRPCAQQRAQRLREVWQAGTTRDVMASRAWESVSGPGCWDRMPAPVRQMISDHIVTMTAPMVSSGPPIATCEQVGALRMPVLLLQSSRAGKICVDRHDGLRRCNAAIAPAVVVPESSHNVHMSNPVFFHQAVLDFVRAN